MYYHKNMQENSQLIPNYSFHIILRLARG